MDDIASRDIEHIVCLGDMVGYGPNPCECLDLIMERCDWALMGNHDFAALFEPTNFNIGAESSSYWVREQLENEPDAEKRARRWNFLGSLPVKQMYDGILAVHGSPRRPINEYIFPDDVVNSQSKIRQIFERFEHICMTGHTHVQGLITDETAFYTPDEFAYAYAFNDYEKVIINVGSVGQPRDRDPRAAYAVFDDEMVEFYRLEYDIAAVVAKIEAIPQLNEFFGQRLLDGR